MDEQKNEDIQDQEFERYGVWVKAGPEEVLEADDDYSMADLDIGTESGEGDLDDLDDDGLVSLDDLDLEEPTGDEDFFETLAGDAEPEREPVSVPESSEADDMFGEDEDDFDLESLNDRLNDDFESLDLDDEERGEFDRSMPGSDEEIEEISLEDIDDYDSSETLPELDIEEEEATEHDFTPEDQGIEIVPDGPNTALSPDEEEFLLEEEDEQFDTTAEEPSDLQIPAESAIPSTMDLQEREAFDRIQTELNEIKNELAELKAVLRQTTSAQREEYVPTAAESTPDEFLDEEITAEDDSAEGVGTGFFEDEEDETIALTGDELDNILNTAEFTEEVGEAEEIDEDFLVAPDQTEEPEPHLDEEIDLDLDEGDEEIEEPVSDIELEEEKEAPFVLEGDDSAVDELADMNIDEELADIESLTDESESDETLDEIEIDLDAIDEMEPPPADQDEAATEEDRPVDTRPAEEDELEIDLDDLDVTSEDLGGEEDADEEADEGFEDFAAAVEQDLGDTGPELEEEAPDAEDFSAPEMEIPGDTEEEEFPTLGDEEPSLELPGDWEDQEEAPAVREEPASEESPEATEDDGDDLETETEEEAPRRASIADLPDDLKQEIRSVLSYMDQLLEALPDDKIEEFAQSEHFEVYKHLFDELGLET